MSLSGTTEGGEADIRGGKVREALDVEGLRTLVVGLGRSGLAVSRFLGALGAEVRATDRRPLEEIEGASELAGLGVEVESGGHDINGLTGVELVVVSPGVPSDIPLLKEARSMGAEVISEMELAARFIEEPIVAVTGTNGKTTTATLLGEVFAASGKKVFVGGNIGRPAIEYCMGGEKADICVLEVSSFHLENISSFHPKVSVLLNITEDHLYRYEDFLDYVETKFRIAMNQGPDDFVVLNSADPVISAVMSERESDARIIAFDATGRACVKGGLYLSGDELVCDLAGDAERYALGAIKDITSLENVMAVMATARALGVPGSVVMDTLGSFKGLEHRVEHVGDISGVTYINDSKATNTGAVINALGGLSAPVVLIAGGVDKGGDYGVLRSSVKGKVRLAVLTGEAGAKIANSLGDITECVIVEGFDSAVRTAAKRAEPGETVLLSPACSSFDEFDSFAERGKRFKQIVGEL